MSEIHNRTSQTVYLDVYGGTSDVLPIATLTDVDGVIRLLTVTQDVPPTGVDDRYYVTLTMADTQNDGPISVLWNFSIDGVPVNKTDHFEVVTPYLTISEVKSVWPSATDDQAREVEAAVRHVINAHTGQSFGLSNRTIVVEGHGEDALRLPQRLIELTGLGTLTATLDPRAAIISGNGFYLKKAWAQELSTTEGDSFYWNGWGINDGLEPWEPGYEKPSHGYVISAPGNSVNPTPWRNDYPFRITGRWGYEYVPEPVKQAAKLLVNDYACTEALYRDRYLESIKAADWRLQFSSRAWQYTGNVRADQLLAQYVLLDWAII